MFNATKKVFKAIQQQYVSITFPSSEGLWYIISNLYVKFAETQASGKTMIPNSFFFGVSDDFIQHYKYVFFLIFYGRNIQMLQQDSKLDIKHIRKVRTCDYDLMYPTLWSWSRNYKCISSIGDRQCKPDALLN